MRNAMLAVAQVLSAWERETNNAAEAWARHIDDQVQRSSANNERWDAMQRQLGALQERLDVLDCHIRERSTQAAAFEAGQRHVNARGDTATPVIINSVSEAIRTTTEQLQERVMLLDRLMCERCATAAAFEAEQRHVNTRLEALLQGIATSQNEASHQAAEQAGALGRAVSA